MGREVRMVPADWQHPRYTAEEAGEHTHLVGRLKALLDGRNLQSSLAEWDEANDKWMAGLERDYSGDWWKEPPRYKPRREDTPESYAEWDGERPDPADYMPDWPEDQRTHFMMYENTSEGTPISPAFATAEELARWLADNGASSFASNTATYEQWLETIRRGHAISLVIGGGVMQSGVEAGV